MWFQVDDTAIILTLLFGYVMGFTVSAMISRSGACPKPIIGVLFLMSLLAAGALVHHNWTTDPPKHKSVCRAY